MRVWLLICLGGCTAASTDDTGGLVETRCEGADPTPPTWYADLDGDGFGRAASARAACEAPEDFVANADDCDDARAAVFPGASEACDGLDGDCDGLGDDTDPDVARATWYADADADSFGDDAASISACTAPAGHVATGGDCADDNPSVYPNAPDECGGGDDDCDGADDACARAGELPLGEADAALVGEAAGDGAGTWIAAGDVDGDGVGDVLTSAPGAEGVAGAAWLVRGPFTGTRRLEDADLRIAGSPDLEEDAGPIGPVALGDLDGDGLAELVVAAPGGGVWRFVGSARGAMGLDAADGERLGGAEDDAGTSLAIGGDLDGDGLPDLVVGAPGARAAEGDPSVGGVAIVSGAFTGTGALADTAAWLLGETDGGEAGAAVSSPGDVDGDGVADLLVGAPGAIAEGDIEAWATGAAYVFYGPIPDARSLADADARLYGAAAGDRAGAAVAGVGDVDGDGLADVMVGAPGVVLGGEDTAVVDAGAAYLLRGPVLGDSALADAHCTLLGGLADESDDAGEGAGARLVPLGDMNQDGRADVAIGGDGAGRAWLLLGPFAGTIALTYAEVTLIGGGPLDDAGRGLAGGADLDGDGGVDLLVGSPGADEGGSGAGLLSMVRGWVR
ncbi:MAG: VCBS repeat-containing protein [Pseudomonadota bacterium]|nr:VCBS repeat-containing protein [Pseudomonadota bacterium]